MQSIEKNIEKLKLMCFLGNFLLPTPVVVLFWLANGLNLTQVMLLQSWFAIIIALLELPSGYFADIYGRKNSLIIASFSVLAGVIIYSFGKSFAEFLIAESLWGIGTAFSSGADMALLYDSLKEVNKEKFYKKYAGSIISFSYIAMLLSNVIGGFIGKIDLRLTFFLTIPFYFALFFVSLTLKEIRVHRKIVKKNYVKDLFSVIKNYVVKHRKLRAIFLYSSLLIAFTQAVAWLYQPYFKLCKIDVVYFGIIFAMLNVIGIFSSKYAYEIEVKIGIKRSLLSLPLLLALSYFFMAYFVFPLAFVFAFIQQFIRGFSRPVITDYINSFSPSRARATLLSANSLITKLFYASLIPFIGYVADVFTIQYALLLLGFGSLISGVLSLLLLYKAKVI